jgi:hypothetical protein
MPVGAIIAPVALITFEPFTCATVIAHEDVGLLSLVPRINGHDSINSKLWCSTDASRPPFVEQS